MSLRVEMCLANSEMTFFLLFLSQGRTIVRQKEIRRFCLSKWLKLKLSVLSRSKEVLGFR